MVDFKNNIRYANVDIPGKDLVIVAGSNPEDVKTAEQTASILTHDFGLEGLVLVTSKDNSDQKNLPKDVRRLYYGEFTGGESMFEGGRRTIIDLFDNKHVVFIKHFYSPLCKNKDRDAVKINDNIHEMRMLGSLLKRAQLRGDVNTKKFSLCAPYPAYVRSHSIEKLEEQGLYQGDSLGLFVSDCSTAGIKEMIGIDPHSSKIWSLLSDVGIYSQNIDPFQNPNNKDWRFYGSLTSKLKSDERFKALLKFCPFFEWLYTHEKDYKKLSGVQPDAGAYDRVTEFGLNTEIGLENIIAFIKERDGEGNNKIVGIQHYSHLQEKDIKGRDFIMIDDLIGTGGTSIETAKYLKERGANNVYIWVTHNAGRNPEKLERSKYIDGIVMLDTVRNKESEKFVYLEKSGILMGGAVYKSYNNLLHRH